MTREEVPLRSGSEAPVRESSAEADPATVARAYEEGRREALALPECRPWDANLGALGRALEVIEGRPPGQYPWNGATLDGAQYPWELNLGIGDVPIPLGEMARRFAAWMDQPEEAYLPRPNPWGAREPDAMRLPWYDEPAPGPTEEEVAREAGDLAKARHPDLRRGSKAFAAALEAAKPEARKRLERERAATNARRETRAHEAVATVRKNAADMRTRAAVLRRTVRHAKAFCLAAARDFGGHGAIQAAEKWDAWAASLEASAEGIANQFVRHGHGVATP